MDLHGSGHNMLKLNLVFPCVVEICVQVINMFSNDKCVQVINMRSSDKYAFKRYVCAQATNVCSSDKYVFK